MPMPSIAPSIIPGRIFGVVVASGALLLAPTVGHAQPVVEGKYCEAPITRREVLRSERGNPLYVAPEAMLERNGELLIAGPFSVEFSRDRNGEPGMSEPNSVLAVIRRVDGKVLTFPRFALPAGDVVAVRAVSLAAGSWGVLVLSEQPENNRTSSEQATLGFATLTHSGWGAVEQVPLPQHVQPQASLARHMVVHGDRVSAAMPADSARRAYGVLLVERERGRWRSRFINTEIAAYTALARDGATGELALAVVRADHTQATDGNSLFLMYPDRADKTLRLLVRGGSSPVHHPVMHSTARGLHIAWRVHQRSAGGATTALQATLEPGRDLLVRRLANDPARITAVVGPEALAIVATQNKGADSTLVTLHALPAPSVGVRLTYSSTFAEVLGAARWSESEVAVSLLSAAKDGGRLINEILWIGTRCANAVNGESATDATSSYRSPHHDQTSHSSGGRAAAHKRLPD